MVSLDYIARTCLEKTQKKEKQSKISKKERRRKRKGRNCIQTPPEPMKKKKIPPRF